LTATVFSVNIAYTEYKRSLILFQLLVLLKLVCHVKNLL